MYTFEPLRKHLVAMGRNTKWLCREIGLTSNVVVALNNDKSVTLANIAKICAYLDLPIEDVVRITKP